MALKKETINIKTANGNVTIVRSETEATITEERTCYGFKEKSVTEVNKLSEECMHYAFETIATLTEMFKNN